MVSANDKAITAITLSGGECHDAIEDRKLLIGKDVPAVKLPLLMDRTYE